MTDLTNKKNKLRMASRARRPSLTASHERFKKKLRKTPSSKTRAIMPVYQAVRGNRVGGPFPVQKSCQMVYTEVVSVSLTAGTGLGKYTFVCNGLFDPNLTGTGTQPLYFDQLANIYNHYTVTSSFIEVQPMGTTSSKDMVMAMYIDDDATTDSDPVLLAQRPGAKFISYNPGVQIPPTVTLPWSAYKTFGPNVLNNELYRGSLSANPSEMSYYCCVFKDYGLASGSFPMRVKITFNVTWTEYQNIAGS